MCDLVTSLPNICDILQIENRSMEVLYASLKPILYTAAAKSLQSSPTLCDPIDGSPLGSSVPGILQARTLEWVAISFSNAWKWKVKVKSLCRARLLVTPWTAAYQAPPSTGFFQARELEWGAIAFSILYILEMNISFLKSEILSFIKQVTT